MSFEDLLCGAVFALLLVAGALNYIFDRVVSDPQDERLKRLRPIQRIVEQEPRKTPPDSQ